LSRCSNLLFFHYSKTKKRFTSLLWHQIWTATRPRIINTFWYNNDFFFTRNKEIGKCVLLSFFFILQCLRLFSIDLVRIFFVFHFTLQFLWAGGREDQLVNVDHFFSFNLWVFILEGQKIKPKNAEEVVQ
jgi:hypothetical protein